MLGWRPTSEATSGPSTTSARTLRKPLTRATAVYIMKEVKILAKMDSCSKIVYQTQLNEFSKDFDRKIAKNNNHNNVVFIKLRNHLVEIFRAIFSDDNIEYQILLQDVDKNTVNSFLKGPT